MNIDFKFVKKHYAARPVQTSGSPLRASPGRLVERRTNLWVWCISQSRTMGRLERSSSGLAENRAGRSFAILRPRQRSISSA